MVRFGVHLFFPFFPFSAFHSNFLDFSFSFFHGFRCCFDLLPPARPGLNRHSRGDCPASFDTISWSNNPFGDGFVNHRLRVRSSPSSGRKHAAILLWTALDDI